MHAHANTKRRFAFCSEIALLWRVVFSSPWFGLVCGVEEGEREGGVGGLSIVSVGRVREYTYLLVRRACACGDVM